MGEFFKPWRRKLGVMTLLMACGFMAAWIRAICVHDLFDTGRYIPGPHGIVIDGYGDSLAVMARSGDAVCLDRSGEINTIQVVSNANVVLDEIITVPYWSIVIPLTLLSAYLLLRKPRVVTQKKITDPTPTERA